MSERKPQEKPNGYNKNSMERPRWQAQSAAKRNQTDQKL